MTCQKLFLVLEQKFKHSEIHRTSDLVKQLRLNQTMESFYELLKRLFLDVYHHENSGYFVLFLTILFYSLCQSWCLISLVVLNVFHNDKVVKLLLTGESLHLYMEESCSCHVFNRIVMCTTFLHRFTCNLIFYIVTYIFIFTSLNQ